MENRGLTPWGIWTFSHYAKMEFLKSRKSFFSLRTLLTSWFGIFKENETQKKFQIFEGNHGLTLRQNGRCPTLLK